MPNVVTISASYGAHGDEVARTVADRLNLPFLDRAIPAAEAHVLAMSGEIDESLDEPIPNRWARIAAAFANTAAPIGPVPIAAELIDGPERIRLENEALLTKVADTTGAVILGRAGMAVLGGRPDVLCVRLDGPVEVRIKQAMKRGIDEATARQGQREIDRARNSYTRVFFNVRQDDPKLYHLMLDSSALSIGTCVEIVVQAAMDRFGSPTR
jgi:Cytidylate kinase-like family